MDALRYAVNTIKQKIPKRILEAVFLPKEYYQLRRAPYMANNIDDEIINKVIMGRVRHDCNTAGAQEVTIPLRTVNPEFIDNDKYVYHIPKQLTGGRTITSAISIVLYSMGNISSGLDGFLGTNSIGMSTCDIGTMNPVKAVGNAYSPQVAVETTNVRVIGDNMVLVQDLVGPGGDRHLRCMVSHDAQFSNLDPTTWKAFAQLCVLACKAYIYNDLVIEMDTAQIHAGHELNAFKDRVESYADADDLYEEYYNEKWRKIQYFSDKPRYARFVSSLIGRYK